MKKLSTVLLLSLGICSAQAANAPAAADSGITIFRGQWIFLQNSAQYCAEKVPAMKREFERAREHAEARMEQAELTVLDETRGNREGYKPLFEKYSSSWIKYADELVAALKKQNAARACPDLLGNWQAADTGQVLEDWRGFVERNGPVPQVGTKSDTAMP